MKRRVIIIGQGFTGRLSIARSVAEVGCDVTLIALIGFKRDFKTLNTTKPIDGYSKYVKQIYFCKGGDDKKLIEILLENCTDEEQKPIIIPDNDFSAAVIDNHLEELEKHFLLPHIHHRQGAITSWMDKIRQKELATQLGMNVASQKLIKIIDKKYTIDDDISYPCFAKPLISMNGGKTGLKRCDNEDELRKHLDYMCFRQTVDVMVEEFKNIDKEYAVLGFSDGKEVIIPGILEILTMAHGTHFGVAIQGRVSPNTGFEDLVEKFKKYIQTLEFTGIFDIDFYESDGKIYFGELNLRFGGSGYAYTKMGVNLPAMFVKYICGESIQDMQKNIQESATYLNERMLIDEWYLDYINKKEYNRLRKTSDIKFLESKEDPKPSWHFKKTLWQKKLIKIGKKCLRR